MAACTAVPASTPSRAPGQPGGVALAQDEHLLDAAPNPALDPCSPIGLTLFPSIWRGLESPHAP